MAANSKEELNGNTPPNFKHGKDRIDLYLRYELGSHDPPRFSYRLTSSAGEKATLAPDGRDQSQWSKYMTREELVADLNIYIYDHSLIFVSVDSGDDLLWSATHNAIKTLHPQRHLYGYLRYRDGDKWKRRTSFDSNLCKDILFRATYNAKANEENHKFSYFVRYRYGNEMIEYEIDPDIRNPTLAH